MGMELRIYKDRPLIIGATGIDALLQNIRIIVLTSFYSVPLDRGFAHVGDTIDSPAPHETAKLVGRLTEAIELYEPRVKVDSIEFEELEGGALMNGRLAPRVTFSLREGVSL